MARTASASGTASRTPERRRKARHCACFVRSLPKSSLRPSGIVGGAAVFLRSNVLDGLRERGALEVERLGEHEEIEVVLHAGVEEPAVHHDVELLGHDLLATIRTQAGRGVAEQRREHELFGRERERIAEADVDLERDPRRAEARLEARAHALVLLALPDATDGEARGIEHQAIGLGGGGEHVAQDPCEAAWIRSAAAEDQPADGPDPLAPARQSGGTARVLPRFGREVRGAGAHAILRRSEMDPNDPEQTELLRTIWNEMKALGENLGGRIDKTNERLDETNQRLESLETRVDTRLAALEAHAAGTNERLDRVEGALHELETAIERKG